MSTTQNRYFLVLPLGAEQGGAKGSTLLRIQINECLLFITLENKTTYYVFLSFIYLFLQVINMAFTDFINL